MKNTKRLNLGDPGWKYSTARLITLLGLGIVFLLLFSLPRLERKASAAGVKSGQPIWLQEPHSLSVQYQGHPDLLTPLSSRQAEPLSVATGDFDEDGMADLAVGYGSGKGGLLVVHPGNRDAVSPQSIESWKAIAAGNFPPAFLSTATVFSLPARPDFLVAGKMTGTDHTDLLAATLGSTVIHVFSGDGHGHFEAGQTITLPGGITALAAGDFGSHRPFSHVLIGVNSPTQSSLLLYSGSPNGLSLRARFALPAPATSIAFGDLDSDGLPDAAVLAGGQMFLLHSLAAKGNPSLEPLSLPVSASAFALGRFVFDRDPRLQMALLTPDGAVHVAVHNGADSRFWTADELKVMQHNRTLPREARKPDLGAGGWVIAESISGVAPFTDTSHPPLLLSLRNSGHGEDDIVALNGEAGQMAMVSRRNSKLGDVNFSPAEIAFRPYAGGTPVAVAATRVNADGRKGMVMLHRGEVGPSVMEPLPDPTFVVNTTADTVDANPGDGKCADAQGNCSLRAAVMETNADAGVDTIVVPAGTFTLTIPDNGLGNASGGHLDVTDGVNIVGAGSNLTIIQAGTNASNGIDKVFSINPNGSFSSFDTLLSNLTIQFGRNTSASAPFGGGFDWDAGTNGTGSITLSSCILNSNSIASSTPGFSDGGGALFSNIVGGTTGTVTITNGTIQNNVAQDGGGGIWVGSTVPLSISNTQVLNNQAVGGGSQTGGGILVFGPSGASQSAIHGSTISGNQAGVQGGGLYTTAGLLIDQGTVINGNHSAGDGGGVWSNVTNETTTITDSTITANSAAGLGGGVRVDSNTVGNNLALTFSRVVGNTAATGSGLSNLSGNVSATEDWWGCNAGPGSAPCDLTAGTVTSSPWIVLSHTANPNAVASGANTTLTASFLQDSNNAAISASNLGAVIGLPITFGNAVNGAITNAQTTIQSNGTATATFTPSGGPVAHADATVDHATVTANVSVSSFTITISPASQAVLAGNSVSYTVTVAPVGGFNGNVALSLSGCPANTTCNLNPTSIAGASGTATLTVATTTSTTAANSTLTVTGTSGTVTQSATATLSVQDFAMVVTPASQNVNVGSSVAYTVTVTRLNGFTGTVTPSVSGLPAGAAASFNPTTIGGRVTASTMTVSTSSSTPAANSTLTVSGSSGGQSRSTTATLSVKDFQVSVSPSSETINAGASTTYTLTVTPLNGFTGTVTPSVAGLPSGVTGTFNPTTISITSGAASSTLTVATSSSTPAATSTLTLSASLGTLSHSVPATLVVQDFSITPTPPPCINAASNTTIPVSLAPLNGFTGSVNLSVSGLPAGATGSFNPTPVTINGTVTSTLTVTTTASTPGGNYTLTITATGGGITHVATVTLCIQNFTITISPSSQTVHAGASATYTVTITPVNGFTGAVALSEAGLPAGATPSCSPSSVTITSSSGAQSSTCIISTTNGTAGAASSFTVSGTIGSLTQTVSATLNVQNFTLSVTPAGQTVLVGGSTSYTVTAAPVNGYTGTLNCSVSGLPAGATANCPPIQIPANSGPVSVTATINTASSTPAVNVVFTMNYTDTTGASQHSVTANLSTQDFTCAISPSSQAVIAGSSVNYTITVSPLNGFTSPVTFAPGSTPSGVSISFNPNPLNGGSGNSTMTVSTTTSAALANDTLTPSCNSGPISHGLTAGLQVEAITILRPTANGSNLGIYQNEGNAMDGNLSTFSSPLGATSASEGFWFNFPAFSGTPIAVNLKINSAAVVDASSTDFVSANYSTDGLAFTDPNKKWTGIYMIGLGAPFTRSQQTDTVSLPTSTDLTKVMVDGSVFGTVPQNNQQIFEIWIEVVHQ